MLEPVRCNECDWEGEEADLITANDANDGELCKTCPECETDAGLMDLDPANSGSPDAWLPKHEILVAQLVHFAERAISVLSHNGEQHAKLIEDGRLSLARLAEEQSMKENQEVLLRGTTLASELLLAQESGSLDQFDLTIIDVWMESALQPATDDRIAGGILEGRTLLSEYCRTAPQLDKDLAEKLKAWERKWYAILCGEGYVDVKPAAVVEVSGGVPTVSTRGAVDVYIVDYDDGEVNDDFPVIPTRDGDRASVQLESDQHDPSFCRLIEMLHTIESK